MNDLFELYGIDKKEGPYWKSVDGELFETEKEAEQYLLNQLLKNEFEKLVRAAVVIDFESEYLIERLSREFIKRKDNFLDLLKEVQA